MQRLGSQISEEQFKQLYFELHPSLFRVAVIVLKDEADAEDVVQDVFLKLWHQPEKWQNAENLKAYLTKTTQNASLDVLRHQKREDARLLKLEPEDADTIESVDDEALRKALEIAVSKLPPKCRLVFSLSRFEGLNNDEIAEYLDTSKRTVETQISLALKAFRGELRPLFEAHLPGLTAGFLTLILHQL